MSDILANLPEELPKESTENSPFTLVLKKFYNLQESSEFRCIIKGQELKGRLYLCFLLTLRHKSTTRKQALSSLDRREDESYQNN